MFHIKHVTSKLSSALGIMTRIRKLVPRSVLRTIYFALFNSHLQYGLIAWGSAAKSNLKKIITLQNRAVRLLSGLPRRCNISLQYKNQRILKFEDMRIFEISKIMHQYSNGNLPVCFNKYFEEVANLHAHDTRSTSSNWLFIPRFISGRSQRSIKFAGAKVWNDIPESLKCLPYHLFKNEYIKSALLSYWLVNNIVLHLKILHLFIHSVNLYCRHVTWCRCFHFMGRCQHGAVDITLLFYRFIYFSFGSEIRVVSDSILLS